MDIFDEVRQALIASQLQSGGESSTPGENGATFIPTVSAEGVISWENDKGLPNPDPVNIKGPAYTLTESDKQEIVEAVVSELPVYAGEVE